MSLLAARSEAIKACRASHPDLDPAQVNARLVAYCSEQVRPFLPVLSHFRCVAKSRVQVLVCGKRRKRESELRIICCQFHKRQAANID